MNNLATTSPAPAIIILEQRPQHCVVEDCTGSIVRRPLGAGQAAYRCTRCFRRYEARQPAAGARGRLRKLVDDFISWRE